MATKVDKKKKITPVLIVKSTSPINKHIVKVAMRHYTAANMVLDSMTKKDLENTITSEK
ncbi:MAG: hypothetical protein AB2L14_04080 [Candidatus Xenobiia bacterium LiM19]